MLKNVVIYIHRNKKFYGFFLLLVVPNMGIQVWIIERLVPIKMLH